MLGDLAAWGLRRGEGEGRARARRGEGEGEAKGKEAAARASRSWARSGLSTPTWCWLVWGPVLTVDESPPHPMPHASPPKIGDDEGLCGPGTVCQERPGQKGGRGIAGDWAIVGEDRVVTDMHLHDDESMT